MADRYSKGVNSERRPDHLEAWREHADKARRESRSAYLGFFDSLFIHYRESMRIAKKNDRQR